MDLVVLGALAIIGGGAAIYFWMAAARNSDELKAIRERAEKAEGEVRKERERAERSSKKAEKAGSSTAELQRALDDAKQKVADLTTESSRHASAERKLKDELEASSREARKIERRIEELEAMMAIKGQQVELAAEVDVDDYAAPAIAEAAAPVAAAPVEPAGPTAADLEKQLRIETLRKEREERAIEMEKLKDAREQARQERNADKDRHELNELRKEKQRWLEILFEKERDLRAQHRLGRDNYRAYIITKGQLDLALDDLYRIKHGRERPMLEDVMEGGDESEPGARGPGADRRGNKGEKQRPAKAPRTTEIKAAQVEELEQRAENLAVAAAITGEPAMVEAAMAAQAVADTAEAELADVQAADEAPSAAVDVALAPEDAPAVEVAAATEDAAAVEAAVVEAAVVEAAVVEAATVDEPVIDAPAVAAGDDEADDKTAVAGAPAIES